MLAVLLVGAATLGAARLAPAGLAVLLTPVPVLAWAGLTLGGFLAWNLWLNLTLPALSGALAAAVVGAWRLLLTDHQRRRLMSYLPDPLAGALAASDTPRLAGARAGVAVLFVDLAGFTSQSERVGPAGTADLLRRLHGLVDDVAAAHGGYVDSFTGDGAMLVFGVPEPGARDAANALACARALLARGDAAGFELRAGLHFGPVELAQLGGPHRRQVTVAGDTVNLASRLMDAAKPFNARLVASDALARAAERADGPETLTGLTRHRSQTVRGRSAAVDLWTG
jgi:adenylate cyclase